MYKDSLILHVYFSDKTDGTHKSYDHDTKLIQCGFPPRQSLTGSELYDETRFLVISFQSGQFYLQRRVPVIVFALRLRTMF